MVRHIVIWRLKEEAKSAGWVEMLGSIERILEAMRAGIPTLLRMELGVNQTQINDAADLLLLSEFESWQALRDYETHPLHEELRHLIGPLRTERRVLNYEAQL